MKQNPKNDILRRLEEAPEAQDIMPPVRTKLQSLPFGELTWENFEKLCLRLIKKDINVIDVRMYGKRGDNQEGIDIYAEYQSSSAEEKSLYTYQCKREKNFGPSKIEAAITKFLEGSWASKTRCFVLYTQESLKSKEREDEVVKQRERLKRKSIDLKISDCDALSTELKSHPDIITDFFGQAWTTAFYEPPEVTSKYHENRKKTLDRYRSWILEKTSQYTIPFASIELSITEDLVPRTLKCLEHKHQSIEGEVIAELFQYSVLIGESGSGKSTFLRLLAHQLTSIGKTVVIARLPDIVSSYKSSGNFHDALLEISTDGVNVDRTLLYKEIDEPDFLLLDGLDECKEERVTITEKLINWSKGHTNTKVIISSRTGYDMPLPSNWKKFELQPLPFEGIRRLASLAIRQTSLQEEKSTMSDRQTIYDETILSLLTKIPLFVGFIGRLWVAGELTSPLSRTEIYEKSIRLFYRYLPQHRDVVTRDIGEIAAQRVFRLVGWITSLDPSISFLDLKESVVSHLKDEGYNLFQAEQEVEKGIEFWKDRQVFVQREIGTEQRLGFIHPSLGEYAAAQYVCRLDDSNLHAWLEDTLCNRDYTEIIDFACGLGAGNRILNYMLGNLDETTARHSSIRVTSIISASPTVADKYVEAVVKQVAPKLNSLNPSVISSGVDSFLSILPKGKALIASAARNLEAPKGFWNDVAATILLLECGEDIFEPATILRVIESILSRWPSEEELSSLGILDRISIKREGEGLGLQAISSASNFLTHRDISAETCKKLMRYSSYLNLEGSLTLKNKLSQKIAKKVQNQTTENRAEWLALFKEITSSSSLSDQLKPSRLLTQLIDYEKDRSADRVFLESIIRILKKKNVPEKNKPFLKMVELGKLIRGMQWGNMTIADWQILSVKSDLEVLDTVLEGMLSVLDISLARCFTESLSALEDVQRFFSYDLTGVKENLKKNEIGEYWSIVFNGVYQDKSATDSLFSQIPKTPLSLPKWERAAEVELSTSTMQRAIESRSLGISWSAAFLIKHGLEENLAQSILGKENWDFLSSGGYEETPLVRHIAEQKKLNSE